MLSTEAEALSTEAQVLGTDSEDIASTGKCFELQSLLSLKGTYSYYRSFLKPLG